VSDTTPPSDTGSLPLADTDQLDAAQLRRFYDPQARLVLSYRGEDFEVTPKMRVFVLGRGSQADLSVDAPCVSRQHARVIYRQGKFVLIDQSKNGSYVRQAGASELCLLQQDEFPLTTAGVIGLGQSTTTPGEFAIRYRCERCSPQFP
jgi:hypothetical protein